VVARAMVCSLKEADCGASLASRAQHRTQAARLKLRRLVQSAMPEAGGNPDRDNADEQNAIGIGWMTP
jgi:hypothetical protein